MFLSAAPLLDVRAPLEFARGAFPGAVNIPLLDDEQRHAVGLRYRQAGQDSAIALGNELVSGELREHRMQLWLAHVRANPQGYLYCFRGGLRSRTVQQWLASAGVDYPLVTGGYKAMRNFLLASLSDCVASMEFIIIAGRTGSGKTLLLRRLRHAIDLEDLAQHRGSSFGATLTPQPGNIDFENAIAIQLLQHRHHHKQMIYLEDEGRMIGRACLPQPLRERMLSLPLVVLDTGIEQRIDISLEAYISELLAMYQQSLGEQRGFAAFAQHHRQALAKIIRRFGHENYRQTLSLFNLALEQHRRYQSLQAYRAYIRKLLCEYYDPMYDYQMQKKQRRILFTGDAAEIEAWAEQRYASDAHGKGAPA